MPAHVVCFSKTGHTAAVCARVAERFNVALHEITSPDIRPGLLGYLRLGYTALSGARMPVAPLRLTWGSDDLLILGAPVWAGRVAVPMISWLELQPDLPSRVALVMTSGQSARPDASFDRFAAATGRTPVATLHVPEKAVDACLYDEALNRFFEDIDAAA